MCVWELESHLDPRTILIAVHKHTVLSTRLTPVNAQAMCKTCFIIQCVNEPDFTVMNSDGNDSSTSCRFITHAAILRDMAIANVCRTAVPCALTRAAVTAVSGAVCLSTEHGFQHSTKTQAKQPLHKILCFFTVSNRGALSIQFARGCVKVVNRVGMSCSYPEKSLIGHHSHHWLLIFTS